MSHGRSVWMLLRNYSSWRCFGGQNRSRSVASAWCKPEIPPRSFLVSSSFPQTVNKTVSQKLSLISLHSENFKNEPNSVDFTPFRDALHPNNHKIVAHCSFSLKAMAFAHYESKMNFKYAPPSEFYNEGVHDVDIIRAGQKRDRNGRRLSKALRGWFRADRKRKKILEWKKVLDERKRMQQKSDPQLDPDNADKP